MAFLTITQMEILTLSQKITLESTTILVFTMLANTPARTWHEDIPAMCRTAGKLVTYSI